jgi:hypothetical protein
MFANNALKALPDAGLDGPVSSLALDGDTLFVDGAFNGSAEHQTTSEGVIAYGVSSSQSVAVGTGAMRSVAFFGTQLRIAVNFMDLRGAAPAAGRYAFWAANNSPRPRPARSSLVA